MKKTIFIALFSLLCVLSASAHEYHVSIINIEFNKDSSSLEIAVKIFTEDISTAIDNEFDTTSNFGTEKKLAGSDSLLGEYLTRHLKLKLDSTEADISYLGNENEEDAHWSYLEVKNVKSFSSVEISCDILIGLLHHQSNLVNVKSGNKKKSVYLNSKRTKATLTL